MRISNGLLINFYNDEFELLSSRDKLKDRKKMLTIYWEM